MPTIVYSHGIDDHLTEYCAANFPAIRFETQPLNLRRASEECDLAILNGTHGTTAAMLLAGKPILFFPIHLEQRMTAERVARLGAGVVVEPHSADSISPAMHQVLVDEALRENARRFSRQYAERSLDLASERIFNRIAGLLRS